MSSDLTVSNQEAQKLTRSEKAKNKRAEKIAIKLATTSPVSIELKDPEILDLGLPPDIQLLVDKAIQSDNDALSQASLADLEQHSSLLAIYAREAKKIQDTKWRHQDQRTQELIKLASSLQSQLSNWHSKFEDEQRQYSQKKNDIYNATLVDIMDYFGSGDVDTDPND